ncbi:MAG: ABC transporter permease [Candidatus Helarchaeales archaeon]
MNHRRFRSLLTIVGIMIGIMTFVSLMAITIGMRERIATILDQFIGAPLIVSSEISGMAPGIPEEMIDRIEAISGVDAASGYIFDYMQVGATFTPVIGMEPGNLESMFVINIVEGRNLQPGDVYECLIGAALFKYDVGDKIVISGVTGISTGFAELTVVGKLASTGTSLADSAIIMPLEGLQNIMNTQNVQFILVECGYDVAHTIAQSIKDTYPDATVIESQEILDMANQVIDMINIILGVISGITLLVGAIGIMNTTMMNVLERTREIGILKSIGATRYEVVSIFIIEALIISILGGVLGCIMGVLTVLVISQLATIFMPRPLPYSFPFYIFVIGVVMALTIGAISALYPSMQAASVKPIEALRYE